LLSIGHEGILVGNIVIYLFTRMSDYPKESPWGPHGPTTDGRSVTPNPTSPWSEPSTGPQDSPNQPAYSSGGSSILIDWLFRPPKKIWLAVCLAWLFGPIGLLYAIGDSRPQQKALAVFVATVILLHLSPIRGFGPRVHPIMLICAVWSIFAARAWNSRHKF